MILICYDGSRDAKAAIEQGSKLLRGHQATVLTVWYPFDAAALGLTGGVVDTRQADQAGREDAERKAREGAQLAGAAGFDAQPLTVAKQTTITDAILDQAAALDATAVLIGSRGLTGVKSMLLGSVSHAVIQHADRPVIVVPSPDVIAARGRERAHRGS